VREIPAPRTCQRACLAVVICLAENPTEAAECFGLQNLYSQDLLLVVVSMRSFEGNLTFGGFYGSYPHQQPFKYDSGKIPQGAIFTDQIYWQNGPYGG